MFSWRSSGGSEPLDGLGNMSKTDILRGIITEKLSTAAREILAVVERTVADYEEEASGFRRQIQRQRRQLELLQPHVKLNRVCVEDVWSSSLSLYDEDSEEQHHLTEPASLSQLQEDLKDPDYQIPSSYEEASKRAATLIQDDVQSLIPTSDVVLPVHCLDSQPSTSRMVPRLISPPPRHSASRGANMPMPANDPCLDSQPSFSSAILPPCHSGQRASMIQSRMSPLFRPYPNVSERQKKGSKNLYHTPWSHDFFCLADPEVELSPGLEERAFLQSIGLGKKKITFKDNNGGHNDFVEGIQKAFPQLEDAGGYKIMRCGRNRSLVDVPMPTSGYSIKYLRLESRLNKAIAYIVPLQQKLGQMEDSKQNILNTVLEKCKMCNEEFPLHTLQRHVEECEGTSIDLTEDTETIKHETESDSEESSEESSEEEYTCNKESEEEQVDKDLDLMDITNDELPGPSFPRPSTPPSAGDISKTTWEKAEDPKKACEIFRQELLERNSRFPSLLLSVNPLDPEDKKDSLFIEFYRRNDVNWAAPFKCRLTGDAAIDVAVHRHMLSMAMERLKTGFNINLGCASLIPLFEGEKDHLVPSAAEGLRESRLFEVAGRIMGHNFLHGGTGLSGLSLAVVKLLTGGEIETAAASLSLEDVADLDHRETIGLLRKEELTTQEKNTVTDLCLSWYQPTPNSNNHDWLFQLLLSKAVLHNSMQPIKQIRKGLKETGIWPLLSARPDVHPIFFPRESKLAQRCRSRKSSRPLISTTQNPVEVRVRFLEDSQRDVLSDDELKSPVQVLRCPAGLQESDFLEHLRSTFPQLAAGEPFDLLVSDKRRRLHPLGVQTPEEVSSTIRSSRDPVLYVRPKAVQDPLPADQTQVNSGSSSPTDPLRQEPFHHASSPNQTSPQELTGDETREEELHLPPATPSSDHVELNWDESGVGASPVQSIDDPRVDTQPSSSTSQQQDLKTVANTADPANHSADQKEKHVWKKDYETETSKKRKKQKLKGGKGREKTACKVCGVWYRILGGLKKHAWTHVDEPQGVCGICGDVFKSVDELKGHLKDHHEVHVCSECGKPFISIVCLNKHLAGHTGDALLTCNRCGQSFPTRSALNTHRRVHLEEEPPQRGMCEESFDVELQLNNDRKLQKSREEYRCNVCGKTVTNRRSLAFHQLTHTGERRHACQVCGKSFRLQKTLKKHLKTHTVRERPFLCHVCCKSFYSNPLLMSHMKSHSSERPFSCHACSKSFKGKGELTKHMRVHSGETPYSCSQCGGSFRGRGALDAHIKSHLGVRPFVCGLCGKACLRQEHLKVHMRTHNGERPYQCSICDKAFTQSHCLKTHMKSHWTEEKPALDPSLDPALDPSTPQTNTGKPDERQ